jgi:MFS family permease
MLRRFSLYGFLKNQRYFEPFIILAFIDKGLSFTSIGLLIAFRELAVNLLEVPSGALADVYGRRKSMIASFISYIASFVLFGLAESFWMLLPAMFLFAGGEAFRTGTHKAMIFSWLRQQGRTGDKTQVYGYTRSWSKIGSAVSVVIATVVVIVLQDYSSVFFLAALPYIAGIINIAGYPASLDEPGDQTKTGAWSHLLTTCREAFTAPRIRRLLLESMGFEGLFKTAKDYLQPVLQGAALVVTVKLAASPDFSEVQRTALLVGPVYMVLHLLSAAASRNAHRLVGPESDEELAAHKLWSSAVLLFAMLLPALYWSNYAIIIVCFVALYALQDFWRPILITRFDHSGKENQAATLLSLENQAKSLGTMVLAPVAGCAVDLVTQHEAGGAYWPIAAIGLLVTVAFRLTSTKAA